LTDSSAAHLPRSCDGTWSMSMLRVRALQELMNPVRSTYKRHQQEIVEAVATHQVTIVSGETGCGM